MDLTADRAVLRRVLAWSCSTRCPVVLARGDLASTCWRVGLQTLKVRTTFGSMVRYHPAPLASDGDKCGKQACSTNVFSAHICTCVASKFSSARFHAHSLLPCRNASRWLRQETMIHAERCQQACDCPGCRHPRVRHSSELLGDTHARFHRESHRMHRRLSSVS